MGVLGQGIGGRAIYPLSADHGVVFFLPDIGMGTMGNVRRTFVSAHVFPAIKCSALVLSF